MSYTTVANVREILGNYAVKPESFTDERIQDAIDSADGEINGYMNSSYLIPLSKGGVPVGTDPLLTRWSNALAAYDVILTQNGARTIEDTDPVIRRYNAVIRTLQSVSTEKITFPYDTSESAPGQSDIATASQYEGDLFGPSDFAIHPAWPYGPDRGGYFGNGRF